MQRSFSACSPFFRRTFALSLPYPSRCFACKKLRKTRIRHRSKSEVLESEIPIHESKIRINAMVVSRVSKKSYPTQMEISGITSVADQCLNGGFREYKAPRDSRLQNGILAATFRQADISVPISRVQEGSGGSDSAAAVMPCCIVGHRRIL